MVTLTEEEASRKVLHSSSWITETAANVFSSSIAEMDTTLEWCHVHAVEAMIHAFSDWNQSLLIEFHQLSFTDIFFAVLHHRCRESRQDKLVDQ